MNEPANLLIPPEDSPRWVPGKVLLSSNGLGLRGVCLRSCRYTGLDVHVPPRRDYMIVSQPQPQPQAQRAAATGCNADQSAT